MLDHVSLGVSDLDRSAGFYDATLAALGYVRLFTTPRGIGYGAPGTKDEAFVIPRAACPWPGPPAGGPRFQT